MLKKIILSSLFPSYFSPFESILSFGAQQGTLQPPYEVLAPK